MENYFNEMLEYQEAVKVGVVQGYTSDWPEVKAETPQEPETPTEQEPEVPQEPETPVTPEDPVVDDAIEEETEDTIVSE